MDIQGLRSPEILAAEEAHEQASEIARKAHAKASAAFAILDNLRQTWWIENIDEFDLEDPEQLLLVSVQGWDRGRGNTLASQRLEEWITSKSKYLSRDSWQAVDAKPNEYELMLPTVRIALECSIPEVDAEELSSALVHIASKFGELSDTYKFSIMETSNSYDGVWSLTISEDGVASIGKLRYSRFSNEFSGTPAEAVAYISQNLPYCHCGKHTSSDSEYNDW